MNATQIYFGSFEARARARVPQVNGGDVMNPSKHLFRADSHLFTLRVRLSTGMLYVKAFEGERQEPNHTSVHIQARWTQCDEIFAEDPAFDRKELFPLGSLWVGIPSHASLDGNYAKDAVLSCLAMKPGDTDREYFELYTHEQLAWAEANGEELSMVRESRYCDRNGAVRE